MCVGFGVDLCSLSQDKHTMTNLQELIPFAKEMLSQRPCGGVLKIYLLGSVLAVLGTVVGLVEAACHPFSSGEPLDAEMLLMMSRDHRVPESSARPAAEDQEETPEQNFAQTTTFSKSPHTPQRTPANRLHAS